ncbi:MAG: efflux RND transporter periplasmic adaptor subunit, partial [Bacteroidota bacterium]|nr:efflux RND transporter periplasmic adaptor subunit [Bacteroidota bacterium]MDX5430976.1 efflux RND transporter periplasmic adaptor subunit [Bacteroidota bacterium]MDX5469727.1 efflux RND transporter periplasmic adaptor subunit [Bacteroidota bacterium]
MKNINKITFFIAIGTLIVGVLLGWVIFGGPNEASHLGHDHTTSEEGTIWTCSMHPQIRHNEPGDCPICGMDLIPLTADQNEEMDPMAISMSPTAMQLAQVETMIVGEGMAEKAIILNGKVQADERMLFTQSSHIPGRIERLSVNFTGEYVSSGQVIAHVYS